MRRGPRAKPPLASNNCAPALASNHIAGHAIDMDITWAGTIHVKNKLGENTPVTFMSDVNANTALHVLGASYGVLKLATDAPHWSHNGR